MDVGKIYLTIVLFNNLTSKLYKVSFPVRYRNKFLFILGLTLTTILSFYLHVYILSTTLPQAAPAPTLLAHNGSK